MQVLNRRSSTTIADQKDIVARPTLSWTPVKHFLQQESNGMLNSFNFHRLTSAGRSPLTAEAARHVVVAQDQSVTVESSYTLGDGVWYFAYGSNMNPRTLTGRRNVVPRESRPAALRGWTLSFRVLGLPYAEPGFATIERAGAAAGLASPRPASSSAMDAPQAAAGAADRWRAEVHGVLHRITEADWVKVMATEGVGAGKSGYRVVEVEVTSYDGCRVRALTLEGQAPSLHGANRPVAPSRRYLDLIRDGARHHGLDPNYVSYLDSLRPYDNTSWAGSAGRAAALAVALPLALPLVPSVLLLRMARKQAEEAASQVAAAREDGRRSSSNDIASDGPASLASGAGAALAAAKDATDMPSRAAASVAVNAQAQQPTLPGATWAAVAEAKAAVSSGEGVSGRLPPGLTRPPVTLPAVASSYLSLVQNFTWAMHDVVVAPLLGSGSSSSSGGGGEAGRDGQLG